MSLHATFLSTWQVVSKLLGTGLLDHDVYFQVDQVLAVVACIDAGIIGSTA
jgi:hypothetical protein